MTCPACAPSGISPRHALTQLVSQLTGIPGDALELPTFIRIGSQGGKALERSQVEGPDLYLLAPRRPTIGGRDRSDHSGSEDNAGHRSAPQIPAEDRRSNVGRGRAVENLRGLGLNNRGERLRPRQLLRRYQRLSGAEPGIDVSHGINHRPALQRHTDCGNDRYCGKAQPEDQTRDTRKDQRSDNGRRRDDDRQGYDEI